VKHNNGFTLIETLAATALAAIMMTAVLAVITAMGRNDRGVTPEQVPADWRDRTTRIIEQDLRHARRYESRDNRITLYGPVSLDRGTLMPTHRPSIVTYGVVENAGQSWLTRTQTDPDARSLRNSWTELVCSGVVEVSITAEAPSPTSIELRETASTEPGHTAGAPSGPADVKLEERATLTVMWQEPAGSESTFTRLIR
jgi:prepilin-type N-terminal cleavage/methylation domain-containing protein